MPALFLGYEETEEKNRNFTRFSFYIFLMGHYTVNRSGGNK